jgi:acetyl-CoA acetyltransferase
VKFEDSLADALSDSYCGCPMGITAENLACKYDVTREDQDIFSLRSQQLAAKSWHEGRFSEEIVSVEVKTRKGLDSIRRDGHFRPDSSLAGMAKLSPCARQARDGTSRTAPLHPRCRGGRRTP